MEIVSDVVVNADEFDGRVLEGLFEGGELSREVLEKAGAAGDVGGGVAAGDELVVAEEVLVDVVDGAEFVLAGLVEDFWLELPEVFEGGFLEGLGAVGIHEAGEILVAEVGEGGEDFGEALFGGVDLFVFF